MHLTRPRYPRINPRRLRCRHGAARARQLRYWGILPARLHMLLQNDLSHGVRPAFHIISAKVHEISRMTRAKRPLASFQRCHFFAHATDRSGTTRDPPSDPTRTHVLHAGELIFAR